MSSLETLRRPEHRWMPEQIWSEILPGLWQGGTLDRHAPDEWMSRPNGLCITKQDFDSVYTFYGDAEPVDWFVKEVRLAFYDSSRFSISPERDLFHIVEAAHRDWIAGSRVLIRCQAGLNRSGLVLGLVLIRAGYTPVEAIELIRQKRFHRALFNSTFERYLRDADLEFWRSGLPLAA